MKRGIRNACCELSVLALVVGMLVFAAAPIAVAASAPGACVANQEGRQLDFWLGDWTVTYPGMPGSAQSKVYLDLDSCLVIESWDGGKGHRGENIFAYSSDDKSWHGMFADNEGRVHVFEGTAGPVSAQFTGTSRGPDGKTVLNKIRLTKGAANKVEQSWEKSADNGITWTMEFQGLYTRKNP